MDEETEAVANGLAIGTSCGVQSSRRLELVYGGPEQTTPPAWESKAEDEYSSRLHLHCNSYYPQIPTTWILRT